MAVEGSAVSTPYRFQVMEFTATCLRANDSCKLPDHALQWKFMMVPSLFFVPVSALFAVAAEVSAESAGGRACGVPIVGPGLGRRCAQP